MPDIIGGIAFMPGSPVWREWIDAGLVRAIPDDVSQWPSLAAWINMPQIQQLAVNGQIY